MKRFIALFPVIFLFSSLGALTINKIKVIGNTHTGTGTILAFVPELKEKSDYTQEELENIIKRGMERLNYAGWFYSANIYIVKSNAGNDYRNIVIEVDEGFLYRFDGGPIYGLFGQDNIYGSGEFYSVALGWNAQFIETGSYFLTKDIYFYAGIGNNPSCFYSNTGANTYVQEDIQNLGSFQVIGYRYDYDLSIALSNSLDYIYSGNYSFTGGFDSASAEVSFDRRPDMFSSSHGYYASATYTCLIPEGTYPAFNRYEIEASRYVSLVPDYDKLALALKIDAAYQDNNPFPNYPGYLELTLAGIDGIRSLDLPDLAGNAYAAGHAELRWDFFHTTFLGIFNIDYEVLTFIDTGEAVNLVQDFSGGNIQYAYGTGLRIFFREPVYIPLRFEAGWDRSGDMSFFFSMNAPF
jgi:hypothetical protein